MYINFRDSKLTRLLSDSLGGNSQTAIICNCSPAKINYRETCSTLEFAHRAKSIRNKVKVNVFWSDEQNFIHKWKGKPKYAKSSPLTHTAVALPSPSSFSVSEKLQMLAHENSQLKLERKQLDIQMEELKGIMTTPQDSLLVDEKEMKKEFSLKPLQNSEILPSLVSSGNISPSESSCKKRRIERRHSYGCMLLDREDFTLSDVSRMLILKNFLESPIEPIERCSNCADIHKEIVCMRMDNEYLRVKIQQLEYIVEANAASRRISTSSLHRESSILLGNQLRRDIRLRCNGKTEFFSFIGNMYEISSQ
ncbi:putative Kinesin-like protein KIF13B, partial [Cardiosporidium cionae]